MKEGWLGGLKFHFFALLSLQGGWVGGWEKWNFALLFVTQEK